MNSMKHENEDEGETEEINLSEDKEEVEVDNYDDEKLGHFFV